MTPCIARYGTVVPIVFDQRKFTMFVDFGIGALFDAKVAGDESGGLKAERYRIAKRSKSICHFRPELGAALFKYLFRNLETGAQKPLHDFVMIAHRRVGKRKIGLLQITLAHHF